MRKRFWKYSVLAALMLCLALVFTACGGGNNAGGGSSAGGSAETPAAEETTQSSDPTGSYAAEVDMTQFVNQGMESAGLSFESTIYAVLTLDLKDDGKFVLDLDKDSLISNVKEALKTEGPDMIKQILIDQGLTEDMFDTIASQSGYDNFDAMVDDMMSQIDEELDSSFDDALSSDDTHSEGTYTIDGDTLKLSNSDAGTIQSDGSIILKSKLAGDEELEMIFKKK